MLNVRERKEWKRIYSKSRRHHIPVRRNGANVTFRSKRGGVVYAQLGTGRATTIMNARIKVKRLDRRVKRRKRR